MHRTAIARACKLRLAWLFNHSTISRKKANRRYKTLIDLRSKKRAKYWYSAYIKGMEGIWGRDLFESGPGGRAAGEVLLHGTVENKWRIIRYTNKTPLGRNVVLNPKRAYLDVI